MKKTLSLTVIALLLSILSPIYAATPTTSVTVYVKTPSSIPVEGVSTSVSNSEFSDSIVTNEQGKAVYDISDVADGSMTVSISLTGVNYELVSGESLTKTINFVAGDQKYVYFGVQEKATTTEPTEETTTVSIPSDFYTSGSETTVLKDMSSDELKNVSNFTIHKPGLAKIKYKDKLDLSQSSTISKLNSLDQYVFIEIPGEVSVANDLIPELNKPATITFEGLNFIQLSQGYTPEIMKDDQDAEDSISNVSLINGEKITFDVTGFSTYSVRPTFEFDENEVETNDTNYTLHGKIDDLDAKLSVYLNDISQDIEIGINDKGEFEIPIELTAKENIVQILAVGISEQTYSEIVTITNPNFVEDETNTNKDVNINFPLIFGLLFLALVAGGAGGYYYYNKRQKLKFAKKTEKYDSRLLTPEERKTLSNDPKDGKETQIPKL